MSNPNRILEELFFSEGDQDEIDLLTLLIEAYDREHNNFDLLGHIWFNDTRYRFQNEGDRH